MAAKHRRSTKKRNSTVSRRDTDRVVRWLQAGAVATGIGAAVINGQGVAWATTDGDNDSSTTGAESPGTDSPNGDTSTNSTPPSGQSGQIGQAGADGDDGDD